MGDFGYGGETGVDEQTTVEALVQDSQEEAQQLSMMKEHARGDTEPAEAASGPIGAEGDRLTGTLQHLHWRGGCDGWCEVAILRLV